MIVRQTFNQGLVMPKQHFVLLILNQSINQSIMLDVSAACDTIDHGLLFHQFEFEIWYR